jgi:hypothetical protein
LEKNKRIFLGFLAEEVFHSFLGVFGTQLSCESCFIKIKQLFDKVHGFGFLVVEYGTLIATIHLNYWFYLI